MTEEAKQAAERRYHPDAKHLIDAFCRGYDAATAKLRAMLLEVVEASMKEREASIRRAVALAGEEAIRQDQVIAKLREALQAVAAHQAHDKDGNYVCWIGESTMAQVNVALGNEKS